jgi:isoleucyl-tRNA synthetase
MAAARRAVELGRAARNAAAVKTRQPLREVVVTAPPEERAALARLRDMVVDELNVKDLRLTSDGADLVQYVLKPNLPVLGPKLGKQLGQVRAALEQAEAAAFVAALRAAGTAALTLADGSQITLGADEVLIETAPAAGYQVAQEEPYTVALNTVVDDELRDEGLAREIVHAVQLARKAADLRIEDTISLALATPPALVPVVERHAAYIKGETLASEFQLGKAPRDHTETARVDGHEIVIGVSATGTIFTVIYG